jgi:hypothetical protein
MKYGSRTIKVVGLFYHSNDCLLLLGADLRDFSDDAGDKESCSF